MYSMPYLTSNSQMEIHWFNRCLRLIMPVIANNWTNQQSMPLHRKIDSDDSQQLWLICHDLEREKRGRNNFNCLQSVRWYPCDVPLATGSLKVQSARHSLAATAWQRSRCSRACPKRRKGVKKKEKRTYILYTRVMLLTRVCFTFQSLLLRGRAEAADRRSRSSRASVRSGEKILPDNQIINSGIEEWLS